MDVNPKDQGRDARAQKKSHADRPKGSLLVVKDKRKEGYLARDQSHPIGYSSFVDNAFKLQAQVELVHENEQRYAEQREGVSSSGQGNLALPCNCHLDENAKKNCTHLQTGLISGIKYEHEDLTREKVFTTKGKVKKGRKAMQSQKARDIERGYSDKAVASHQTTHVPSRAFASGVQHRMKDNGHAQLELKEVARVCV